MAYNIPFFYSIPNLPFFIIFLSNSINSANTVRHLLCADHIERTILNARKNIKLMEDTTFAVMELMLSLCCQAFFVLCVCGMNDFIYIFVNMLAPIYI